MKRTIHEIQRALIIMALENFKSDVLKRVAEFKDRSTTNDELQILDDTIELFRKRKGFNEQEEGV